MPIKFAAPSATINPPANPVTASVPAVNFCSKSKLSNCSSTSFILDSAFCIDADSSLNALLPICCPSLNCFNSSIESSNPCIVFCDSAVSTATLITMFSSTAMLYTIGTWIMSNVVFTMLVPCDVLASAHTSEYCANFR